DRPVGRGAVGQDHFAAQSGAGERSERAFDRSADVALLVERLDDDADLKKRAGHDDAGSVKWTNESEARRSRIYLSWYSAARRAAAGLSALTLMRRQGGLARGGRIQPQCVGDIGFEIG